jgi:chromosome segregation ATPase
MVMDADKKIEEFAAALAEKDAMLNTAHDTLGELEAKITKYGNYIDTLEKRIDELEKEPVPTQGRTDQEALARALVILSERFSTTEIAALKAYGVWEFER